MTWDKTAPICGNCGHGGWPKQQRYDTGDPISLTVVCRIDPPSGISIEQSDGTFLTAHDPFPEKELCETCPRFKSRWPTEEDQ